MPYFQVLQDYPVITKAAILFVLLYLSHLFFRLRENRKIQALGAFAPRLKSWTPGGLGIIAMAVKNTMRYDDGLTWSWLLSHGNSTTPYTVEGRLVGLRIIWTADPENIKAILATQFADYGKGPMFHKEWSPFLGDSIFTTDGTRWQESRQLLRPQFIKDRVSDLQTFENHVGPLISLLAGERPVDIAKLFFRFTLDAATEFLLGESVATLTNPSHSFADAFAEVQRVHSVLSRAGPMGFLVSKKSRDEGLKVIDELIHPFIEHALRLSPEELEKNTKSDHGYTFLHALAGYTRDRKVLRDQLVAVLLAGRDTTACTLSWMFYELSRRPVVVAKLRREIIEQVGTHKQPSYADLKSMKYLQHTINETLRLYPILPYNVREALHDTTLPHGGGPDGKSPVGILKGTPIGYSTLIAQRRRDIYPPTSEKFADPLEFSPERWEHWTPQPWTYVPFNGGPRICVGQNFALAEMAYTTVRILQAYNRIESRMDAVPREKAEIVLQPSDGVTAVFFADQQA